MSPVQDDRISGKTSGCEEIAREPGSIFIRATDALR